MTTLLDIHVQQKSFGGKRVLEALELRLEEREIVALLGPSGCGKSTLLRIAAGLDDSFSGTVRRDQRLRERANGGVAFVFQEPRLMPWLTVAQNIGFADGRQADPAWISQLLNDVGLAGWEDALPRQLSGGMAQRVAIARGLYSRPGVLLLDEPFSAVDAFTRMKLQDLLLSLASAHEIALLLVTHDIDESIYLADRVLIMGNGSGREEGNDAGAAHGTVRATLTPGLPRPRQRADERLALFRTRALEKLHEAHAF